jgi:2-polyprenyl-3-methyl-5-hydroxy-6-metoxy-1,4-benzoquinol methylase
MEKTICPSCMSINTHFFYEVYDIPIYSTTILSNKKDALNFPKGNVSLHFCKVCGFIFNNKFDPNLLDYSVTYEDQQGFSGTFLIFLEKLASYLLEEYNLYNKTILEIGCGKGDFLNLLNKLGNTKSVGIDPAFINERFEYNNNEENFIFIKDFFSSNHQKIKNDMICCRHTLEHISDTASFMKNITLSANNNPDTIIFFEVPDVIRILKEHAFWDVYYEHCSYFSPGSLARLFKLNNLDPIKLRKVYNNQYLTIEARLLLDKPPSILDIEESVSQTKELVNKFKINIESKINNWKNEFENYDRNEIIIWGSGSKCVSFITTLKIQEKVKAVIDINPYRQGYYLPSIGHKIVNPEYLIENKPELLLIMNSIYEKEIKETVNELDVKTNIISLN